MKTVKAIVYASNTGFTARYAAMLGEKTALPVYELSQAESKLERGASILYMGWLFASNVKGYSQAARCYQIAAVCAVGLCETGTLIKEVRKTISLPQDIPLFTMQGGMDHSKLRGFNKLMINMLIWALSRQKELTDDKQQMLTLIKKGGDYVSEDNLAEVLKWYHQ